MPKLKQALRIPEVVATKSPFHKLNSLITFSKNLAAELGVYGIRVVNIRSGGSPDSRIFREFLEQHPNEAGTVIGKMEDDTMLKKMPLMEDIANTAVFLASDLAGKITGVTIDVTSGTTAGLNYKVERV